MNSASRYGVKAEPASPRRAWLGDAGVLLAGALLPLAYAPYGFFPLAVLLPATLFTLWLRVSPVRALWRGWLFGAGMFGAGVYWIYISIHQYGNAGVALAAVLTAGFIAGMALFPAVAGWLVNRFFPVAETLRLVLVMPAVWTLVEWVRGWFLTGFPWLDLGYSQAGTPLAVGVAPLLGVYGVSWVVALSAGLLAVLVRAHHPPRWLALGTALLVLWWGAALLGQVQWTRPQGKPLRVSLIQGDITQNLKWNPAELDRTLDLYRRLTREHWNSALIVWPETAVPAFYQQVQPFLAGLGKEAREHGSSLLIGVPVWDAVNGRYYNAVVSLGERTAFYYKHHLVPFGEYIPFKDLLGGVLDVLHIPMSDFSAGARDQPPLPAAGYRAGVSICYEDAFGALVIRALPQAAFLVNVSDDAWFGDSAAPYQHLQIARLRAQETGRYLLSATNTGITAIIGPHGRIQASAPAFQVAVLTGTIQPMRGATPYVRWGNGPVLAGLAAALAAAAALGRRRDA